MQIKLPRLASNSINSGRNWANNNNIKNTFSNINSIIKDIILKQRILYTVAKDFLIGEIAYNKKLFNNHNLVLRLQKENVFLQAKI